MKPKRRPYPPGPSVAQATPSHYGIEPDPHGRVWEDLLQDEKIEKLMSVTTRLWNRMQQLEHENQDLRRHKHNEYGDIYVARGVGEREDSYYRNDNPFNSKEMEQSETVPF